MGVMRDKVEKMSDDDVMHWFDVATKDLLKASEDEPNSEWHSACFAASVMLAQEMNKRGLTQKLTH